MATALATRPGESNSSPNYRSFVRFREKASFAKEKHKECNKENEQKIEPKKRKEGKYNKLTTVSATSTTHLPKKEVKFKSMTKLLATTVERKSVAVQSDLAKVKRSALLYEITEHTNRLAQPRIRGSIGDAPQRIAVKQSKTSVKSNAKVSPRLPPRILELAKPKCVHEEPAKDPTYVAPCALRAVATERIIELSKPKRKRRAKQPRKKKVIYAPCRPRIVYLSRPKKICRSDGEHRRASAARHPLGVWSSAKQLTSKKLANALRKSVRKTRQCKISEKERARSTNSNRTIISINLDFSDEARSFDKKKTKKSCNFGRGKFAKRKRGK